MTGGMDRRQFLGATAGAVAVGAAQPKSRRSREAADPLLQTRFASKARIGKVYLARPNASWPNRDLDLPAEMKRYEDEFKKMAPQLDDVEFVGGDLVTLEDQLPALKEKLKGVSGILAIHLSLRTGPLITGLLELGVPITLFSMLYSGHEWHIIAPLQKEGKKIEVYPTSRLSDLVAAIAPIRTLAHLRNAKVLYLPGPRPDQEYIAQVKTKFGAEIQTIDLEALTAAYNAPDAASVRAEAKRWTDGAKKRVEPTDDDISRAARMYLAMRKMIEDEKAQAITINCLGSGLLTKGQAYPCFGFSRLSSMGVPGICEADLKSTMTALMFQYLANKPGFVSDPIFDLSNNTIIHAHCVAPLRMNGPDGEECPYIIRSHHEDHKGASLYVRMRVGQPITMARLIGTDVMLVSAGEIIDTPYVDRGCRTKITTKVNDAQKILEGWSSGLHRVIFYGDHRRDVRRLARLLDLRVVEEGVDDPREIAGLEWRTTVHP